MTRTVFIILIIAPFFIAGAIFKEDFPTKIFPYMAGINVPIITFIRWKYQKLTWKQILFFGGFRVFKRDK